MTDTALEYMEDHSRSIVSPVVAEKIFQYTTPLSAIPIKKTKEIARKENIFPGEEDKQAIAISSVAQELSKRWTGKQITNSGMMGAGSHNAIITEKNLNKVKESEGFNKYKQFLESGK